MKTIYSCCSDPFWLDVAEGLRREIQAEPIYWLAHPDSRRDVLARFPQAVFHSSLDAIRGLPPSKGAPEKLPALDQTFLLENAHFESLSLKMMDRMDPGGAFPYGERIRLYYSLVRYWLGVLDQYRPGLVFFPTVPHMIHDFVLFNLAKLRGVKTLMFGRTGSRGFVYPMADYEVGPEWLRKEYRSRLETFAGGPVGLSEEGAQYMAKLSARADHAVQVHWKERNFAFTAHKRSRFRTLAGLARVHRYPRYAYTVCKTMYSRLFDAPPSNYLKVPGKRIEDSKFSSREYRNYKKNAALKKDSLALFYNKLAKEPDFSRPYVFAALSYQPEQNTSPMAGVFVHQLLMVDILSRCVPDDWQVYVKEHPVIFRKRKHGERSRDEWYYEDLAAIPKVRIMPMSTNSFELADKAKVVATSTGTIGWESLARGKPVLVFGHPWYKDCEGAFFTPSLDTCKTALQTVAEGYTVDVDKVHLYLKVVEDCCYRAYNDNNMQRCSLVGEEENLTNLIRAVTDFLGKY